MKEHQLRISYQRLYPHSESYIKRHIRIGNITEGEKNLYRQDGIIVVADCVYGKAWTTTSLFIDKKTLRKLYKGENEVFDMRDLKMRKIKV